MFPWFIVYFLAIVAANSLGLIPHGWHAPLSQAAVFLITTALAGIGLSTRFRDMRRTGLRPLALGAVLGSRSVSAACCCNCSAGNSERADCRLKPAPGRAAATVRPSAAPRPDRR